MWETENNLWKKWRLAPIFSTIGNISSLSGFAQINMRMIEDLSGFQHFWRAEIKWAPAIIPLRQTNTTNREVAKYSWWIYDSHAKYTKGKLDIKVTFKGK